MAPPARNRQKVFRPIQGQRFSGPSRTEVFEPIQAQRFSGRSRDRGFQADPRTQVFRPIPGAKIFRPIQEYRFSGGSRDRGFQADPDPGTIVFRPSQGQGFLG